jgi:hypothetical protein
MRLHRGALAAARATDDHAARAHASATVCSGRASPPRGRDTCARPWRSTSASTRHTPPAWKPRSAGRTASGPARRSRSRHPPADRLRRSAAPPPPLPPGVPGQPDRPVARSSACQGSGSTAGSGTSGNRRASTVVCGSSIGSAHPATAACDPRAGRRGSRR